MEIYIALLRGINVGGHNPLPMSELKSLCAETGFKNVRTYIQSGNAIFESAVTEEQAIKKLEQTLKTRLTISVPVMIRTVPELESVLTRNPFPEAKPARIGVHFFTSPVPKNAFKDFKNPGPEEVIISGRELYVHYPAGMGRSKLKLPKLPEKGTVRNMNTVAKLVQLGRITF